VAIKAEAAGLVHKSDLGAVRLGLEDPGAVSNAVAEIDIALTAADLRGGGYLVQRMGSRAIRGSGRCWPSGSGDGTWKCGGMCVSA
jgi:acyl-CoA synthetase (NDP forming)